MPSSGSTLRLSMVPGLVQGLSLSLVSSIAGGVSSDAEDWNTKSMEATPGELAWLGAGLSAGYDLSFLIGHELRVGLELLVPDLGLRPDAGSAALTARYRLDGELSVHAGLELDALLWNDREIADDSPTFALAFAGDARADWMGMGLSLEAAWKQAGYGGWGGNDQDDRFDALGLWQDFESAKHGDAIALDAAIFADPAAILGMDLGSLSVGYRVFLYGTESLALQGAGWHATLGLKAFDLTGLPLSLDLTAGSWTNPGLVSWDDSADWPLPGLLDGVSWKAAVSWAPSDRFSVSLEASDRDSGYKRDTYRVVSLGAYARISF